MVERPIKKSERQIAPPSDAGEETREQIQETQTNAVENSLETPTAPPEKRKVIPSVPGKEKSKGRGKGGKREEEPSPPMNLALMRGPKPTKPKPPVVTAPTEEAPTAEVEEADLETAPTE